MKEPPHRAPRFQFHQLTVDGGEVELDADGKLLPGPSTGDSSGVADAPTPDQTVGAA